MSTVNTCRECGMNCQLGEYHPFVACLIYKGCHDATVTRENIKHITQQWRDIGYREAENHIPSTGKMVGLTRITEQDAREIISSYVLWRGTEYNSFMADKFAGSFTVSDAGRALLDKLNAGRADHLAEAGKKVANTIDRRALEWAISNDTGLSSEAICAHMLGLETEYARYPSDPADLGRCLRLLELIPEWKPRIKEMASYGPGWAGQIEVWDELNNTMANEVGIDWSKGKKAPETYKAMKLAQANGYRKDPEYECGFDKNGFISWSTKTKNFD